MKSTNSLSSLAQRLTQMLRSRLLSFFEIILLIALLIAIASPARAMMSPPGDRFTLLHKEQLQVNEPVVERNKAEAGTRLSGRFMEMVESMTPADLPEARLAQNPVYMRSTVGPPWGLTANEDRLNGVFGSGNWQDLRYETANPATVFSPSTDFVFMEGGESNADELETFLNANMMTIQNWVNQGGCLLVNAAPNEGDGMSFGFGVSLTLGESITGSAANPAHPIFNGPATPVGTSFTGDSLSHASVSGAGLSPLILDSNSDTILGEMTFGTGLVLFGGLTLPFFDNPLWSPQPDHTNLHTNIITYIASCSHPIYFPIIIKKAKP